MLLMGCALLLSPIVSGKAVIAELTRYALRRWEVRIGNRLRHYW
jgi:hypothetical protein